MGENKMLLIPTIVQPSKHGMGLFTTQALRAGQCVWCWDDLTEIVVPAGPHPEAFAAFVQQYGYLADGIGTVLNLDNSRFMNHSDSPNLTESDGCIYATQDIAEGEEITCDYRVFDHGITLCGAFLQDTPKPNDRKVPEPEAKDEADPDAVQTIVGAVVYTGHVVICLREGRTVITEDGEVVFDSRKHKRQDITGNFSYEGGVVFDVGDATVSSAA